VWGFTPIYKREFHKNFYEVRRVWRWPNNRLESNVMAEGPMIWKDGELVPLTSTLNDEMQKESSAHFQEKAAQAGPQRPSTVLTDQETKRLRKEMRKGLMNTGVLPWVIVIPVFPLLFLGIFNPIFWWILGVGLLAWGFQWFTRLND
jgi:hypothetical protein